MADRGWVRAPFFLTGTHECGAYEALQLVGGLSAAGSSCPKDYQLKLAGELISRWWNLRREGVLSSTVVERTQVSFQELRALVRLRYERKSQQFDDQCIDLTRGS